MLKQPLFLFALALCLPCLPLSAAPVPAELLTRVKQLDRDDAHLRVELHTGPAETAKLAVRAQLDPQGLTLSWPTERVTEALQIRAARKGAKGGKKTDGDLDQVKASGVLGYLNAADQIAEHLSQAELVSEERLGEQRVFVFKLTPPLEGDAKKYVKELAIELRLVTLADYTPVSARMNTHVKGRAFVVITFGEEALDEFTFAQSEGHLYVTRHHRVSESNGTGGEHKSESEVRLEKIDAV